MTNRRCIKIAANTNIYE